MSAPEPVFPESVPIPSAAWRRSFRAPDDLGHRAKHAELHDGGSLNGVPLGGIGTGGIGRDWRGAFRRWTLKPGAVKRFTEPALGFGVYQRSEGGAATATMLAPRDPGQAGRLESWSWPAEPLEGAYAGLFPKAWLAYPSTADRPVSMVCEQFSPVLPGDYEAACLPVALFRWHLENGSDRPVTVGLLFSFAGLNGWFEDPGRGRPLNRNGGAVNRPLEIGERGLAARGVVFDCARTGRVPGENRGLWAIAALAEEGVTLSRMVTFDALGGGGGLWDGFAATGAVPEDDRAWTGAPGFAGADEHLLGGAVSATLTLAPGERRVVTMALVWDLPVVAFGLGRRHWRRYTRAWGRDGCRGADLAAHALRNAARWSEAIDRWHADVSRRAGGSEPLTRLLLNELYLMVDGYTVWTDGRVDEADPAPAFFGLIECPDYPYYSTFDLWVYASFAVVALWPELERTTMRLYTRQILRAEADGVTRRCARGDRTFPEVSPGAVPHDLGAPGEDPGVLVNAYTYQDPTLWKDQPAHFVLTLARDVAVLDDDALLADCWPAAVAALDRLAAFDRDGDGLIENDGIPDQTFDNIPMTGPSAYCGGLWLGALQAGARLADRLGETGRAQAWRAAFARGREAYDTALWTGTHYRIDRDSAYADAVFVEQLFGAWYARRLGLDPVVPDEKAVTALRTILARNLDAVADGGQGAVNLSGDLDAVRASASALADARHQSDEVLVGINLSLANQLRSWGLEAEAARLWAAVDRAIYAERGLWFRTPAAYDPEAQTFRAIMNLRPLVVWAALEPSSQP